ncbi:lytic transglycosylase [Aeromonas australiensis]|nr:lytic transglycosylase [Aeromonas australiensis]
MSIASAPCRGYQHLHWQDGFPVPIQGKGAELVNQQHLFLLKQRPYLARRLTETQPVVRWVSEQVHERNLPPLLALVPLLESSYRLDVVSSVGAAGPWQLMPDTATRFSVPINQAFDGRYSLPLATDAALSYLAWLNRFFGNDWLLALAAYNAGEGRVMNAVLKAGTRNVWELELPTETRLYIARFVALARLLDMAANYQFQLPPWNSGSDLQIFRQPDGCSLVVWAQTKGVSMNEASRWNPAWQLPTASGITNCPIVYSRTSAPSSMPTQGSTTIIKAVSLESLHDPLLLKPARGLDMSRSDLKLERLPDPLGIEQKRPLLVAP